MDVDPHPSPRATGAGGGDRDTDSFSFRVSTTLQNVLARLSSSSATERKRGAEELEEILNGSDTIELLNFNSLKPEPQTRNSLGLLTWNVVFNEVKNYFEKLLRSNTKSGPAQSQGYNLFKVVIDRALAHGSPYLNLNTVFTFIYDLIYNDLKTASIVGIGLVQLIYRIVSTRSHLAFIDAGSWKGLLLLLIKLYKNTKLPRAVLLETMNIVIVNSSNYPVVIPKLRKEAIEFFKNALIEEPTSSLLYQGATLLCNHNALEFRGILCKFGEEIIGKIFFPTNSDIDESIVEFILVQLRLHSPCDIKINSPGFHAHHSKTWVELLETIYAFCIDAIDWSSRKSGYASGSVIPKSLLTLAVKVTKQVSDFSPSSSNRLALDEFATSSPAKRLMMQKSFVTVINDVILIPPCEPQLLWLTYITGVLQSFPELVQSTSTVDRLFRMGMSLLNSSFSLRPELHAFLLALYHAHQYILKSKQTKKHSKVTSSTTTPWHQVWDIVIKSLMVQGEQSKISKCPEILELLRSLLIEIGQDMDLTLMLNLFLNHSLGPSEGTLNLLIEFLSRCKLPQYVPTSHTTRMFILSNETNKSCPRSALIHWVITSLIPQTLNTSEEKLGRVLCSLVLNRSHTFLQSIYQNSTKLEIYKEDLNERGDFEQILLDMSFVKVEEKTVDVIPNEICTAEETYRILNTPASKLCSFLEEDLLNLPPIDRKSPEFMKKLILLQQRIKIILILQNNLDPIFDVSTADLKDTILDLLVKSLERYMNNITEYLGSTKVQLSNLLNAMKNFYTTNTKFSNELKQLIAESCTVPIRDFWHSSCLKGFKNESRNSGSDEFIDDVRTTNMKVKQEISLEALRILILYGNYLDEEHRFQLFAELFQMIGTIKRYHVLNQFYFDLATELIHGTIPIFTETRVRALHKEIPIILQTLCRHYKSNSECVKKLWKLFHDLGPLMAKEADNIEYHYYCMVLVNALTSKLQTTNSCYIPLLNTTFRTLAHFARVTNDPLMLWTAVKEKDNPNLRSIYHDIREYLNKGSQQIRLNLLNVYWDVFRPEETEKNSVLQRRFTEGSPAKASELRKVVYQEVYTALMDLCEIMTNLSDDELKDETQNRTSIIISFLTKLVFIYPFNQRRALFSLLLIVKLKNLSPELTNSALKYYCSEPMKTLKFHLLYMLGKWLKLKYNITEFPYRLYDCSSYEEFAMKYRKEITFQCFFYNEDEAGQSLLSNYAATLNTNKEALVEECFGLLVGRLIPGLGTPDVPGPGPSSSSQGQSRQISLAKNAMQRLTSLYGGNQFLDLLRQSLPEIFLHIISCTYQPDIMDRWNCSIRIPEPEPPFLDEERTKYVLEYELKERLQLSATDDSVLGNMIKNSGKSIFQILEPLLGRIHAAHDELEKFWKLHQFSFFISLFLSQSKETIEAGNMKPYIAETVAYSYFRLLNPKIHGDVFVGAVLHVLYDFIKALCLLFKDEMDYLFRPIVHQLISISTTITSPKLYEILDYLMIISGSTYSKPIASLAPFPEIPEEFEPYRKVYLKYKYDGLEHLGRNTWSLEKELKTSLDVLNNSSGNYSNSTAQLLRFLKVQLSERKPELEQMVDKIGSYRFSDECRESVLHNLIQVLIDVVKCSQDKQVQLEACRCLGEIGPIDLGVLVLPSKSKKQAIPSGEEGIISTLELVHSYLLNEDINLSTTSSNVLLEVLKVNECLAHLSKLKKEKKKPRFVLSIRPFTTRATVNLPLTGSVPTTLESKLMHIANSEYISYSNWIRDLTLSIISSLAPNDNFFTRLVPLCKIKIEFCQEILPYLIYACLKSSIQNTLVRESLSKYFQKFFCNFTASTSGSSSQGGLNETLCLEPFGISFISESQESEAIGSIYTNKRALRMLLDVVQFLRNHQIPGGGRTPWENNFWLDINYLDLAKAAQYCGVYLTTILCCEIYAYGLRESDVQVRQVYSSQQDSQNVSSRAPAEVERLLLKSYISIGEIDAVYGCGTARYSDLSSNLQHLEQMNQWNRALSAYDCQVTESETAQYGTCRSLKEQGLLHTLWTFMEGIERQDGRVLDPKLEEIRYECAWRLSKWDFGSDKPSYVPGCLSGSQIRKSSSLQKPLYESLQFGFTKDKLAQEASITRGYLNIVQDLRHSSVQSSENLYNFLTQFQQFRVVEDFYDLLWAEERLEPLTTNWKLQNKFSTKDLKFQEPVLSLESIVLQSCISTELQQANNLILLNSLDDATLHLITSARIAGRLELAENLVYKIIGTNMQSRKEIEIAKNHWARGEKDIAMLRLGNLIKRTAADRGADLYAAALILYGEWLIETKSESPSVILEQYFFPGVRSYESGKAHASLEDIANAHIILAKYADSLYQNVYNYVKSDGYQEKVRTLVKLKSEVEQLKQLGNQATEDQRKTLAILGKHISLDAMEISSTNGEITKFLSFALKHYLLGLKKSTARHDLLIFRAVGLWLENINFQETTKTILDEQLPTYKYVIVLHQLTARLGISGVQEALNTIITKCTQEHPHHSLPVLLSLVFMNKDKDFLRGQPAKKTNEQNSRVLAARKILETVKKSGMSDLVNRMEALWSSLISLANYQIPGKSTDLGIKHIPDNAPIRKLKGLESIPIPTTTIDVSPTGTYQGIIGIKSFSMTFNMVGGINSPKRISCLGTNGINYNLLLKGQDDLRQDQVMQQVFGVMNQLLKNESASKSRRLLIRTYKVVPLSQRSGIIEWVENTTTLGDYLVGSGKNIGAHQLYRPSDYTPLEGRRRMFEVKDCGNNTKKLEVFNDILQNLKPVFRHFFFENFKESGTFFERRLAYTRSVATSSMVGYILGLGDRHVLNILIDTSTAEFIHIDLGVAFEQGKILPTPETIPFRLSRDIVDGMGLCGVEGDFRRSCEITLDVLRNNAEIIVTVLEVLLYDPLYFWTLSSDRVQKVQPTDTTTPLRQGGPARRSSTAVQQLQAADPLLANSPMGDELSKEKNTSAARVLLRLKQKLVGVEEGMSSGSTLSVPGHVSLLIQRAMDNERLSRLFAGWQPYL